MTEIEILGFVEKSPCNSFEIFPSKFNILKRPLQVAGRQNMAAYPANYKLNFLSGT